MSLPARTAAAIRIDDEDDHLTALDYKRIATLIVAERTGEAEGSIADVNPIVSLEKA